MAATELVPQACAGEDDITEVSVIIDILDGELLKLSGGGWCALQQVLEDDALLLAGQTAGGVGFLVTLDSQRLTDSSSRSIDG